MGSKTRLAPRESEALLMNLYRIARKSLRVYDEFSAMTIRASSPSEARELAVAFVEHTNKEYPSTPFELGCWSDPNQTEVHLLELGDGPTVIATEFRHG